MGRSEKYRYGRNVLITGASKGIGLATARLFAAHGYRVWALARHRGPETDNVTWLEADVTSPESLDWALSAVEDLGIVIHCAGMGIAGSAELTPDDAVRRQFDVNYFGVLNVNRVVLAKLRKRKRSLVLLTSSVAGLLPIPYQSHYSSTKYALEAYGEALAMEGRAMGLRVCIVEPGDTRTSFTASRVYAEPSDSPYLFRCGTAVSKMERDERNGRGPESVARVFYRQACRRRPRIRVAVGFEYRLFAFLSRILPYRLRQRILEMLY